MQRFLDILFSLLAFFFLLPIFLITFVALRFSGEGEVFYIQERVGFNRKIFKLFKFATMLKNSPNTLTGTVTLNDDPRILPLGKFLRKTKINELPQLVNILLGDMSIIGPRPMTPEVFSFYPLSVQKKISLAKPGLSGIGSIIFHREDIFMKMRKNDINFYKNILTPYKGLIEEWYVDHKGLKVYLLAIVLTLWVLISKSSVLVWKIFKDLPTPPFDLYDLIERP
jgi:lipopolysaccharide/colanic/teichoic acid biosynthesis glycosyltransferase